MISVWPVRTGIIVEDGITYFGAGLFPKESVYLCALDALDGTEIWQKKPAISPQGYLLASATRLYVPAGRTTPAVFSRKNGEFLGQISCPRAEGGTYALLTEDTLISGPGTRLSEFNTESRDRIATYPGRQMIITDEVSYLLSDIELSAIDRSIYSIVIKQRVTITEERRKLAAELSKMNEKRKELKGEELKKLDKQIDKIAEKVTSLDNQVKELENAEYTWRQSLDRPYYSMILAGVGEAASLFVGGNNEIVAYRASDGEQLWSNRVEGKAYSLLVANNNLFVSTDKGFIHCFSEQSTSKSHNVSSPPNTTLLIS